MRPSIHETFIKVAWTISERSTCARKKVGGILVSKEGKIISSGWNGTAKHSEHCDTYWRRYCEENKLYYDSFIKSDEFFKLHGEYSKIEIHAETNVLLFSSPEDRIDSTLYLTISPCLNCSKLILQSGIKRVVYEYPYDRDTSGIEFLQKNGIVVQRLIDNMLL